MNPPRSNYYDDDDTSLKDMIKYKHAPMLNKVAARGLVLWKCSGLPDDDNLEQNLKTLQFDGSDVRLVRLASARRQLIQGTHSNPCRTTSA
jgi:hypothetical protein